MIGVLTAAVLTAALAQDAASLHHADVYLDSLFRVARIQAPRLHLAALHTFIAHPSLLERWHVINSDAAASYNDWTNTLVLQPEMTKLDQVSGRRRIRSLAEMNDSIGPAARVSAGVVFHELSHAEWDFYVESGDQPFDRDLLAAINRELPTVTSALASEIFAYYREELVSTILNDAAEIRMASGLNPDTDGCSPLRNRVTELRDFSPNAEAYATRVQLTEVWVRGREVRLDLDAELGRRLNAALFAHATATLGFPKSRAELFDRLAKDRRVRAALETCLAH